MLNFNLKLCAAVVLAVTALEIQGCKTNPNRAEKIQTDMDHTEKLGADETIGVKNGDLVVQKKVAMNKELQKLQYRVYELEDRIYGNREYGSKGLYGALKDCRAELVSPKYGGDGKLIWTEPIDRVTQNEDDFNVGLDEHDKIVAVSQEFLRDRIARFKHYKEILLKRQDEYEGKLEVCDADLKAKKEKAQK